MARTKGSRNGANDYVDNAKFLEEMIKWCNACQLAKEENKPVPSNIEEIGKCIWDIANHLAYKPNFINYSFTDMMIDDAIENCVVYAGNFDPAKSSNPFSYFTQICFFAFVRRILKEKKQQYIIAMSIESMDNRGQFAKWAKNNGVVDRDSSNPYAEYMKLTAKDYQNFESSLHKKPKQKKTVKSPLDDILEDVVKKPDFDPETAVIDDLVERIDEDSNFN